MTPTEEALSIIQYWKGVAECDCNSTIPHGSCLLCDMTRVEKIIENQVPPKFLPDIPNGYDYGGVHEIKSLLSQKDAKIAHIDKRGNFSWSKPNNVENKSKTEFAHAIFKQN